jgi:hypothetical protein
MNWLDRADIAAKRTSFKVVQSCQLKTMFGFSAKHQKLVPEVDYWGRDVNTQAAKLVQKKRR